MGMSYEVRAMSYEGNETGCANVVMCAVYCENFNVFLPYFFLGHTLCRR